MLGELLAILRDNYNKEKSIFIEGSDLEKIFCSGFSINGFRL
jgi:hypothetical protein